MSIFGPSLDDLQEIHTTEWPQYPHSVSVTLVSFADLVRRVVALESTVAKLQNADGDVTSVTTFDDPEPTEIDTLRFALATIMSAMDNVTAAREA